MPESPLVQFRVTPEQKAQIDEAAELAGVERSSWLRQVVQAALDSWHPPVEPEPEQANTERPSPRECWHPPSKRRMGTTNCGVCGLDIGGRLTTRVGL